MKGMFWAIMVEIFLGLVLFGSLFWAWKINRAERNRRGVRYFDRLNMAEKFQRGFKP